MSILTDHIGLELSKTIEEITYYNQKRLHGCVGELTNTFDEYVSIFIARGDKIYYYSSKVVVTDRSILCCFHKKLEITGDRSTSLGEFRGKLVLTPNEAINNMFLKCPKGPFPEGFLEFAEDHSKLWQFSETQYEAVKKNAKWMFYLLVVYERLYRNRIWNIESISVILKCSKKGQLYWGEYDYNPDFDGAPIPLLISSDKEGLMLASKYNVSTNKHVYFANMYIAHTITLDIVHYNLTRLYGTRYPTLYSFDAYVAALKNRGDRICYLSSCVIETNRAIVGNFNNLVVITGDKSNLIFPDNPPKIPKDAYCQRISIREEYRKTTSYQKGQLKTVTYDEKFWCMTDEIEVAYFGPLTQRFLDFAADYGGLWQTYERAPALKLGYYERHQRTFLSSDFQSVEWLFYLLTIYMRFKI